MSWKRACVLLVPVLIGCPNDASEKPIPVATETTETFEEENLGYRFRHDRHVVCEFNPHALRKVRILHDGRHVGGFTVSTMPEGLALAEFLDSGFKYYEQKYDGARIAHQRFQNSLGHEYYRYTVQFEARETAFTEERFIFIKSRPSALLPNGIDMTFTFNFLYPREGFLDIRPSTFALIDTFEFLPNDPLVNDAMNRTLERRQR